MKCEEIPDVMLDVIYGEDVSPARALRFFSHLKECPSCESEYLELLGTRAALAELPTSDGDFSVQLDLPDLSSRRRFAGFRRAWWPGLQRVAALVLIFFGVIFILQSSGLVSGRSQPITEEQLRTLINDVVVNRQDESMRLIGQALVTLKEDILLRNRAQMEDVYENMDSIQRNLFDLDSRNRNVSSTPGR